MFIEDAFHHRFRHTSPLIVSVLSLLFIAGATKDAIGQDTQGKSENLTMSQAVTLALHQNLDLQVANIGTAVQQQNRLIARSALMPHAEFDANEAITRYNTKAQLGVQPSIIPHDVGPYQAIHMGPSFTTPVFDLTLIRRYQESGHRLLATSADEQTVREETVLLTVSEYMSHLRAEASVQAAQSRVTLAEQLARQADDLLVDGVATKIDVSRAQVRLREEQQKLIDAQSDAKTSLYALKRILNIPDSEEIEVADQSDFFSTPAFELSSPVPTALAQRPELRSMSENVKAAQLAHKAVVDDSLPKLALNGSWNEQGETFTKITPGYQYSVGVEIPIFTGGRLRAERERTALLAQQAQTQIAQERNRVTEQVRDGQVELQAAAHQVTLGHKQVQLANEEVSLSQGRFQAGVTDNIEVTAAQDSLARANDTEIAALFRYNIARAQLARAVGSMEQTYTH